MVTVEARYARAARCWYGRVVQGGRVMFEASAASRAEARRLALSWAVERGLRVLNPA